MAKRGNRRLRELSKSSSERVPRFIPGDDEDGPLFSRIGFFIVAALAFFLITGAAVWFGGNQIQDDVREASLQLLRSGGFSDIEVTADGRTVTLIGSVPTEEDVALVPQVVAELESVTEVTSELRVVVASVSSGPVAADALMISWEEGSADVTGSVSDDSVRSEVITTMEERFPGAVDGGDLEVRAGVRDEALWLPGVLEVFLKVADDVDVGTIVVNADEGVVTVAAEYSDRQGRAEARRVAEEVLAAGGLDFVSGFTVEDAPPPPPREEVVELQADLDDLLAGKVVEFETNSDRLTAAGRALLDEVLEALREVPDVPVEIAGHADAQGTPEFNLELSQRRADAVLAYLVRNGESRKRFEVIGYGETQPIADNTTAEGRARNRRIEFIALDD